MFEGLLSRSRSRWATEEPFCVVPELQFALAALPRLAPPAGFLDRSRLLTVVIGPTGCGKSTFVRHALREVCQQHRRQRVALITEAEWPVFLSEEAEQAQAWSSFLEQVHLVVLEDLDRALTDPDIADRLTGRIDELLARQVRVVITMSQSPGQCEACTPRLASRLHGGLTVRIGSLTVESRRQVIDWFARNEDLSVSDPVVHWLAEQPPGNFRSVLKLLNRVKQAYPPPARVQDQAAVEQLLTLVEPGRLALAVISQHVAAEFGVGLQQLRGSTRHLALRVPRQCAMHLAHALGGWPMSAIGHYFGRRTHTSVSYNCRVFAEAVSREPSLRDHVQRLRSRLVEEAWKDCG